MGKMDDWTVSTLGECAEWYSGGTPKTSVSEYWDGNIPWITASSLHDFYIRDSERRVTPLGIENGTRLMPKDTILFVVRGMSLKTEFRVGISRRPVAFGQDCKALIPKEGIDPLFLANVLRGRADKILELADEASHGTGRLATDALKRFKIWLPPLDEQKQIAHILGTLDDKIELNQQMNRTLEGIARALFKSWFIDFDPVRAKLDGRQPSGMDAETAALFPDAFEDGGAIGKVPKGWKIHSIEEATSLIIDHRGKTPKKLGSDWAEQGIPAISAKNIKAGRLIRTDAIRYVDEDLYNRWMKEPLEPQDIVMTSEAPMGELLYLARNALYCLSQRLYGIRADKSCCEPTYLFYLLSSDEVQADIQARATGTTVQGIRQSELRKVKVLLPDLRIQKRFSEIADKTLLEIYTNEDETETLSSIRDALLPKLLSGEIRVKAAEPAVEAVA